MSGPYNQPSPDRALLETLADLKRRVRRIESGATTRGGVQTPRIVIGGFVVEPGMMGDPAQPTLIAYPLDDPGRVIDVFAAINSPPVVATTP